MNQQQTTRNAGRRPPPHGFSLVEMLVTMTAFSAVLTLTAVLIHTSMRVHSAAQAFHRNERSAWRLADDLRRDLRAATGATTTLEGDAPLLRIESPTGELTTYLFDGENVARTLATDGAPTSHESYAFRPAPRWSLELEDNDQRVVIQTVRPPESEPRRPQQTPPVEVRLVAQLRPSPAGEGETP